MPTIAFALFVAAPVLYRDGPPLAHTGGFGEPTCQQCHQGEALNSPGGSLQLSGVPADWRPGETYRLTVGMRHDSLARAGFELAVRFADSGQAGTLVPLDTVRSAVSRDPVTGVWYAHHARPGTQVTGRETEWTVMWRAPQTRAGMAVSVHVAAVAANDDDSNLGDRVLTTAATITSRR